MKSFRAELIAQLSKLKRNDTVANRHQESGVSKLAKKLTSALSAVKKDLPNSNKASGKLYYGYLL